MVSYHQLLDYNNVWTQGANVPAIDNHETYLIHDLMAQFQLNSRVSYNFEPLRDMPLQGRGTVIAYLFTPSVGIFDKSSVNLLVLGDHGLLTVPGDIAKLL